MFFMPYCSRTVEVLSNSIREEIARRVREEVYKTLRTGKYLEDAYIYEVGKEIAEVALNVKIIRSENDNSYKFKMEKK